MRIFQLLYVLLVAHLVLVSPRGSLNDSKDSKASIASCSHDVLSPFANLTAWVQRVERNLASESEQRSSVTSVFDQSENNLAKGMEEEVGRGQNNLLTVFDRVILYHQLLC